LQKFTSKGGAGSDIYTFAEIKEPGIREDWYKN
jgi:hypothetical protein